MSIFGFALSIAGGQTLNQRSSASTTAVLAASSLLCESFGLRSDDNGVSLCNLFIKVTGKANWDEAKELAEKLNKLSPSNGIGNFCLGYADLHQGRYIPAVRHFEAALDRSPDVPIVHLNLALGYLAIQQYKLFEAELRWVTTIRPQDALPYYYLGVHYTDNLKQPEQGAEFFREALLRNPNDHMSRYRVGYQLESKGEFQEAKAAYELAIANAGRLKIAQSAPLQGLARIHLRSEDRAEALRYARESVSADPSSPSSRLLLGKVLISAGEFAQGAAELKIATKLDPNHAAPHYLLSQAYRKLGRSGEAAREQEIFVQLRRIYGDE